MIELRRRNSAKSAPSGSRLPKGYQEVEWIQPGIKGAYIQTGVLFGDDTKTTVDFIWEDNPSADFDFVTGVWEGNTNQYAISKLWGSNTICYARSFCQPGGNIAKIDTSIAGRHLAVLHNDYVILDGEKSENFGNTPNLPGYELVLFADNSSRELKVSQFSLCKIYSSQIEQGDVLIRDFIPCYRTADREAGMYDIVNDVFYTNAGNGKFMVGPDVIG